MLNWEVNLDCQSKKMKYRLFIAWEWITNNKRDTLDIFKCLIIEDWQRVQEIIRDQVADLIIINVKEDDSDDNVKWEFCFSGILYKILPCSSFLTK